MPRVVAVELEAVPIPERPRVENRSAVMYDSSKGMLYVLTIPESFTDLYNLPAGVLSRIKDTLTRELPVRVDGPGRVSLFVYDNDMFIVEFFLDEPVDVGVTVARQAATLRDVLSDEVFSPARSGAGGPRMPGFGGRGPTAAPRTTFNLQIKPHSYRVFQCQRVIIFDEGLSARPITVKDL